tara:strand:+ start:105 stop:1034 length:930 start_codon:yes stop_codon:yes gene_type:complete
MSNLIEKNKIFGFEDLFTEFKYLLTNNILPNKILISGPKGIGKYTFAIHFINYVLSANEIDKYNEKNYEINSKNRSFNLMNNYTHPNFSLISLKNNKKNIEIDQIRNLIYYSQKSSFNNAKRFILIDNVELLNKNSSNALLKLLEEPPSNLYFILIHDNLYKILDTIKSRTIIFKKNFQYNSIISISNKIIGEDFKLINNVYLNMYNSIGDLVFLSNFAKNNEIDISNLSIKELLDIMITKKMYKKDPDQISLMLKLIQALFFEYLFIAKDNKIYKLYKYFIIKINNTIKFNLDMESLFFEFQNKIINE